MVEGFDDTLYRSRQHRKPVTAGSVRHLDLMSFIFQRFDAPFSLERNSETLKVRKRFFSLEEIDFSFSGVRSFVHGQLVSPSTSL